MASPVALVLILLRLSIFVLCFRQSSTQRVDTTIAQTTSDIGSDTARTSALYSTEATTNESFTTDRSYTGDDVVAAAREKLLFKVAIGIQTYYVPLLVTVGMTGNILSFLVMIRQENRKLSCCVYMAVLAVADNVALLIKLYDWIIFTSHVKLGVDCVILTYIALATIQFGIVMILAMTVDRTIAIRWPLKVGDYCTVKQARVVILGATAFCLAYNVPHLFMTQVLANNTCTGFTLKNKWVEAYAWISSTLNCFVPFVMLITLNTYLIRAIRARTRKVQAHDVLPDVASIAQAPTTKKITRTRHSMERQLSVMLLLVSFMFLALTVPQYVRYMTYLVVNPEADPDTYAQYLFAYHFSNKLFFTNNALNFFLYTIGGSKFREGLRAVLTCQKRQYTGGSSIAASLVTS